MAILTMPISIGGLRLKNRITMAPMGTHFDELNSQSIEYYVRRAEGGAGMIIINATITDYFEDTSASLVLNEHNLNALKEIVKRSHLHDCKICIQLMAGCGRMAGPSKLYPVPISASECSWLYSPEVKCHALTNEEINRLLDECRRTVKLAIKAGVDAFEIHAYGGYLSDQFLTAAWNTRTDRYGGDVKGRATFILEQMDIVKQEAGEKYPIIVKFSAEHGVDYPGFRKLSEGLELAAYLEEKGATALHVDVCCYEKWQLAMPPIYYQKAVAQLNAAKAVKQKVKIPVLTHGRLYDIGKAEAALREKICDIVVIGRGLLADPELPNKVMAGRTESIRPCISCNEACIGNVVLGKHVECVVNPFAGHEYDRVMRRSKSTKSVLVVGGGPAGCTAALLARQAGHMPELWEKSANLGGKAIAAASPYMKNDMHSLIDYYKNELFKLQIPVRFLKKATRENIKQFAPDAVIWAAGGKLLRPKSIKGIDSPNVYSAEAALRNQVPVGNKIVIVGGGLVGVETALHFDHEGHDVTVIEMTDKIMPEPQFIMNDNMLREMMSKSCIEFVTNAKVEQITDDGVIAVNDGIKRAIKCDTVLLAMGWTPDAAAGKVLEDICPVYTIGDSNECRDIHSATTEAYYAVASITEQ